MSEEQLVIDCNEIEDYDGFDELNQALFSIFDGFDPEFIVGFKENYFKVLNSEKEENKDIYTDELIKVCTDTPKFGLTFKDNSLIIITYLPSGYIKIGEFTNLVKVK